MMWRFDRYGDRVAAIDERGQSLTYHQLCREGRLLTEATAGRSLVMCLCENSLGSLLGYTACVDNGLVPLMLSASMDRALLKTLYDTYQPRYLWAPERLDTEECTPIYRRFGYQLLETPFCDAARMSRDLALLLTTSGSTGSPKLVRTSYRNLRSNTDSIVKYLGITKDERPISTLPMNYTYGLSILNTHLDVGAALLLTEKGIAQKEFWQMFKEQKATSFGGVPYTYEMLDRMRFMRMDLPSLRSMTQAGGKLQPDLHRKYAEWCRETGRQFIVMYGQTEASPRMGYLPWEMSLQKIGSMGVAVPGGRFELIDAQGGVITEPDVVGELRYYGDNVTLGYAECAADLTRGDERHGELDTGDMAKRDADGCYTIVGRKKRFLKVFGNRVNLDECERLLKARFPQADVACAGRDDRLTIFATDEALLPELREFLSATTGLNASAFHTVRVDAIPKSDSGKTLYKELEQYDA